MKESATFQLTISSIDTLLFQDKAISVTLPGERGQLTILAKHEPLITLLTEGKVRVIDCEGTKEFAIKNGLCETSNGQVTVLL